MRGNEVKVTVSAEVNTILSDLYGQIEYELRDDYEDGLEKAMQELERYKNIIDELERYIKTNYNYYTGVNDVNLAKKYVYKDLLDKIKNLLKGE